MSNHPLMPKATAVWLIDNTALSFDQIAAFCGLHPLEVKGIADGDVAASVRGINPITTDQLTREEIAKGENDPEYKIKLTHKKPIIIKAKRKKAPRYTPLSKRQNRPDAIAWMVRNHPEVSDAQISRLLGTTKSTIVAIRDRTHWNAANLEPRDPVGLGLCTQIELDAIVNKAAKKKAKMDALNPPAEEGPSLMATDDIITPKEEPAKKVSAADVFANFTDDEEK